MEWEPINNEYILRIFGRVEIDETNFFITHNYNNSSLRDCLDCFGTTKEQLAKRQLKTLVYGVVHCHSRGIVHNRINIDSIFIGNDANFLLDFVQTSQKQPTEEEIFKYLYYFAPELLHKKEISEGCDVWAIGCVAL